MRSNRRATAGPRDWYTDADFDNSMDDLRARCGEGVFERGRGVDVDLVLQRGYDIGPDFVVLPAGVLGRTTFFPDGKLHMEVSRALADAAEHSVVGRRRLRSTLAHECGHVVFHRHHFVTEGQGSLFGSGSEHAPGNVLCREDAVDDRLRRRDGREYQANRGMASLLLPNRLVRAELADVLKIAGFETLRDAVAAGDGETVLRGVGEVFDVSFEMTLYRVRELQLLPKDGNQSEFGW